MSLQLDIPEDKLKMVFEKFDKDKSGNIERGEIKAALIECGLPPDSAEGIAEVRKPY